MSDTEPPTKGDIADALMILINASLKLNAQAIQIRTAITCLIENDKEGALAALQTAVEENSAFLEEIRTGITLYRKLWGVADV